MSEKTGRIILISMIALTVISIIIVIIIARKDGIGTEMARYEDKKNIEISHTQETGVAKVSIEDSYIKDGETYYEITTSASGIELFTMSQAECDTAFGAGNTAVDCETYRLEMSAEIVSYFPRIFTGSKISHLDMRELIKYKDNPFGLQEQILIPDSYTATHSIWQLCARKENKDGSISTYYFSISCNTHPSKDAIRLKLTETRYSFLGEKDFTEEEIREREEYMDQLSNYLLEAFLNSK